MFRKLWALILFERQHHIIQKIFFISKSILTMIQWWSLYFPSHVILSILSKTYTANKNL